MTPKASADQEKKRRRRKRKGRRGSDGCPPRKRSTVRPTARQGPKTRPAVASAAQPADDHELSQDSPNPDAEFIPRPVHFRLLDAYESAFQEGRNPTDSVIAGILKVRRETVNRWRRRNPRLRAWLHQRIRQRAEDMRPYVDRRVTHLALSGSVEHTKLFYQYIAKVGAPHEDGEDSPEDSRYVTHVNILVPCPEVPNGGRMPVFGPQPAVTGMPDLKDIPTVSVR